MTRGAVAAALVLAAAAAGDEPSDAEPECMLRPAVYHYLQAVQDRVLDGWQLPEDGMANREVVVKLTFEADGSLRRAVIVSADDTRLKHSVAAAILRAVPFAPIPSEASCLVGLPIRTTFRNPAD